MMFLAALATLAACLADPVAPCRADPAGVHRAVLAADAAYVVTPAGAASGRDVSASFEEALEDAERRAREGGARPRGGGTRDEGTLGGGDAFVVERTLRGAGLARLVLPQMDCDAPAYLVAIDPDGRAVFPLSGTDDPVLDAIPPG